MVVALGEAAPALVTQGTPDVVTEEMPLASQQHKDKIKQETLDLITVMTELLDRKDVNLDTVNPLLQVILRGLSRNRESSYMSQTNTEQSERTASRASSKLGNRRDQPTKKLFQKTSQYQDRAILAKASSHKFSKSKANEYGDRSFRKEKEGVETELSEASLSPYMAPDFSDSAISSDDGPEENDTDETEVESVVHDKSHRESINLLRKLYNEANYGAHLASFGAEHLEGKALQNRVQSLTSPYIKRHKPSLNVRRKRPSKVGHRLLTRSPVKRAQHFGGPPRRLKPSITKNFIKENIESVKVGQRMNRGGGDRGKTRVVYDVEYDGCLYRVLPCHVKSTPNSQVLSVNIEDDLWVDVARNAVTRKLEYIGSIQAFKLPRNGNRDNDIWVYKCKIGSRNYTIDPQDVRLCPKDGCTYLVHLKDTWHQLDTWGVCKLLKGQISPNTIVHKSTQHAPRPKQPYKCSFSARI
ncbi:hypothetical protein ACHWQZ_G004264 [Mnemiopsis leidyi]